MNKQEKIKNFDPSQPGLADESKVGLPFTAEESEIIIIPVPWEVTVSYGSGASNGPAAILEASFQVDLHHQDFPELWKLGMYLDLTEQTKNWADNSDKYKGLAQPIIAALESGEVIESHPALQSDLDEKRKESSFAWWRSFYTIGLLRSFSNPTRQLRNSTSRCPHGFENCV
jgi:agmatinase